MPVLVLSAAVFACTGDTKTPDEKAAEGAMAMTLKVAKEQQRVIDSVMASAPNVKAVVDSKNRGSNRYDVADDSLSAVVRREAKKTNDCYTNTLRDYDPHLAGKVTVLVNFGAAGWDLIRVEDHTWTGPAGGVVETCINLRAKKEWALPTHGVKAGAHLVQLEFRPDSMKASAPAAKTATKSKQ